MDEERSNLWDDTRSDESTNLNSDDIRDHYTKEKYIETYGGQSVFRRLFTPKSRAVIIDALLGYRGEPATVRQIVDHDLEGGLSTSSFNRQRDALLDLGVMVETGKQGNAMTYALNTEHPVVQLLVMMENVVEWGETPQLLEDQFLIEGIQTNHTE